MKTQLFSLIIIAVLFATSQPINAEVVKKAHKSWPVNKVTSLSVENKFGNITFISNRNDSVIIDVRLETYSGNHGNPVADQIDFVIMNTDGQLSAKTNFADNFKTKQEFTINYIINIPEDKALAIDNKYGNVTLENLNANGKFIISHGSISAKKLNAPKNETIKLDIKYGSANFDKVNNLLCKIAYSKMRSAVIGEARLESNYSTILIEKCDNIIANSRYDNYTIEKTTNLKADTKFTQWKIENVTSSINIINQYGDIKIENVSKDFDKITVNNNYSNVSIGISKDASYMLKAETYYCDVIFPDVKPIKFIEDNNHKIINALIGSNATNSKVNIESRYGKVDLME